MHVTKGDLPDLVRSMLPPWFNPGEHFCVTVNRNVQCAPHRDRGNVADVGLMFLGEFEGGALATEGGECFEQRGVWHRYDGGKVKHWNEPITSGTKYAVVLHNNAKAPMVFPRKVKDVCTDVHEEGASLEREAQTDLRGDSGQSKE